MWNVEEIIEATGGVLYGNGKWSGCGVSIDSRTIKPGEIFIALTGERFDGHDYLQEVYAKGAAAAVVSQKREGVPDKLPLLEVKDTFSALNDMAVSARNRTQAKIIAITGSVGKTGTKEALAEALRVSGKTHASRGNYNNHLGLPLSMANMPPDADYAIFELGMNHAGEISYLTRLLVPEIAIITAIEPVHLEFFPSVEAIADAKAEIFESMNEDGIVILNRDNQFFDRLKQRAEQYGIRNIAGFGVHEEAQGRMENYRMMEMGSEIEAVIDGTPMVYRIGALGRHWGVISTAVLLTADILKCDLARTAESLANFREPEGRGRLHRIAWKDGYITLIDDSYNASSASMMTAFAKLDDLHRGMGGKGRKIVVLGDMLELGLSARDMHLGLLPGIEQSGIDMVYASGTLMKELYDMLPPQKQGKYMADAGGLIPSLMKTVEAGDVVLVKGSHGSRMHTVAEALKKHDAGAVAETGKQDSGVEHAV